MIEPRRAARWALGVVGAAAGLWLLLFPAGIVRAFFAPSPLVTIRTVSGDVEKTTIAALGADPVPIDVDGDSVPDVDVGVAITAVEFVPGNPVSPTLSVRRDPLSLNDPTVLLGTRASPPLEIEIVLNLVDPEIGRTDSISFGYETPDGGSIPASFRAALLGNLGVDSVTLDPETIGTNFVNPLRAEVATPGYNGPLRLFSNIDAEVVTKLIGNVSLAYDPLPERVGVVYDKQPGDLKIHYEQQSLLPDVDVDTHAHLETPAGVTDLHALIQRLPATLDARITEGTAGGSLTYVSTGPTSRPDIDLRLESVPAVGDPLLAVARVAGLPSRLSAAWPLEAGTAKTVSLDAPDAIPSVDFEIRNFIDDADAPDLPPALKLPPRDHLQFVSRGFAEDALWAARGHVSAIRTVSVDQGANLTKTIHAKLGDGAHPFRAGIDVETRSEDGKTGRLLVDSTVTNLPADLTAVIRPQDDTAPDALPLLVSYAASAETDVVAHLEIGDGLDVGCREPGSTCGDVEVRHVPESVQATFTSVPDRGRLRVVSAPRPGGAKPDITADLVRVPADPAEQPVDVHAVIKRFPQTLVTDYHLSPTPNDPATLQPDLVGLHSCDWDGAACVGEPDAIGQVNFRMRNFLEGSFGTDELTPSNYISVVSRQQPDRFEVSGQTEEIRHIVYRKAGQVGGVHVEMGNSEPFRVHADIDDPKDSPPQQQIVDSTISALPDNMNVCFRSPVDDPVAPVADPTGITNDCQTDQAFGGTIDTTPFTVIYDATKATPIKPVVDARAKVLFGGNDPVGAGERQDAASTQTIKTVIKTLPSRIRADYRPAKALGDDVFGRPLKVSYESNAVVDSVTLDVTDRRGISQCEDPRKGMESLCAHVDIAKLPTLLRGTITSKQSKTNPVTTFNFQAGTPAEAAAMRIGCTGLPGGTCGDVYTPGLHLVKVKNPGNICFGTCGQRPQVIDASIDGLPVFVDGEIAQAIKRDPETGADAKEPALTKLTVQACSAKFIGGCVSPGEVRRARFSLQNFLVPDPLPEEVIPATLPAPLPGVALGGQFFHFVKRGDDFRMSGALAGLRGATFASPGDTTAVNVQTTNVDRNFETLFDIADDGGSSIRVAGTVQHLPPVLDFCFRAARKVAFPESPIAAGKFCDASNSSASNATPPEPSTRIRLHGDPGPGGKPNAVVGFSMGKPGSVLEGQMTAVGLPPTLQTTFDENNVGFNKDDLPGFALPNPGTIDSVRFNVHSFAGTTPPALEPFTGERFAGDPNTVPINVTKTPQLSVVTRNSAFQAKGIVNGVREAFLFTEPCRTKDDAVFQPQTMCKRLHAETGVGLPAQPLGVFMHSLKGTNRMFLTADIEPLPKLLDAYIDTESSGFSPKGTQLWEQVRLVSPRPPMFMLKTCNAGDPDAPCTGAPGSFRGIFESGRDDALKAMAAAPFRDPGLAGGADEPNPGVGGALASLVEPYYSGLDLETAAKDLKDLAKTAPPAAAGPNLAAFRIGEVGPPDDLQCTSHDPCASETVVRGRFKIPFPDSIVIDSPVMLQTETDPHDEVSGTKIDDMRFSASVSDIGGGPVDLGRGVVVMDDLLKGADHGDETVIIASNLPGELTFKKYEHTDKKAGSSLLDVGGTLNGEISHFQMRKWDPADKHGPVNAYARKGVNGGGALVPNLRLNIHNIPPQWRARAYSQAVEDIEDRLDDSLCTDAVDLGPLMSISSCTGSQQTDLSFDMHPRADLGVPAAKRLDAIVSQEGGSLAWVKGFQSTVAPGEKGFAGETAAEFNARATVRIAPLTVDVEMGIPGLSTIDYELSGDLDVNLFSVGKSEFKVAFAEPAHLYLASSAGGHCAGTGATCTVDPGVYFRPVWDVRELYADGTFVLYNFFGIELEESPRTLPMSGLDCVGGVLGAALPEIDNAISGPDGPNGYNFTDDDEQNIALNVITVPHDDVDIDDDTGGVSTRTLAANMLEIMCIIGTPDDPVTVPEDPLKLLPAGDPGDPQPPAPTPPPPPAPTPTPKPPVNTTVMPGQTLELCGRHRFDNLTVNNTGTLKVAATANPVPFEDGQPRCDAASVGRLRIETAGAVKVDAGGKILADAVMTQEPPLAYDGGQPGQPNASPVPFSAAQARPDTCGGGAGYGGQGGASACATAPGGAGGTRYGHDNLVPAKDPPTQRGLEQLYSGSPGAAGGPGGLFGLRPRGGLGGGMVWITAKRVELYGQISANGGIGQNGFGSASCATGGSGGGGSGGGILVAAKDLLTSSTAQIFANGGKGGDGFAGGGGGGGGRIKLLGVVQTVPSAPSISVSGGAAGAGTCAAVAPQGGAAGVKFPVPPRVAQGAVTTRATTLFHPSAQPRIRQRTYWSNVASLFVNHANAATSEPLPDAAPVHEIVLCYYYEGPTVGADPRKLPEEQPLVIPARAQNQTMFDYLKQFNCRWSGIKKFPNGSEFFTNGPPGALDFVPGPDGYYGVFTVGARRLKSYNPADLSQSCMSVLAVNEVDCEIEPVPEVPDLVMAKDGQTPNPTDLSFFGVEGQRILESGCPAATQCPATNRNRIGLKMTWVDKIGTALLSNSTTGVSPTIYKQCIHNEGQQIACFGPGTTSSEKEALQPVLTWDLSSGDGLKKVSVSIEDWAGNVYPATTFSKSLTVDTTKPESVAVHGTPPDPGPTGWYTTPPTVTVEGTDVQVGLDNPGLFYAFDDPEASRTIYDLPVGMPEGKHTLYGVALNKLGNELVTDAASSFPARVDTKPPVTGVTVVPKVPDGDNGWYRSAPFVGVKALDVVPGSGIGTIRYSVNNGAFQDYTGFFQVGEGDTTVCARAVDKAGNTGAVVCSPTIRVDSTMPVASLTAPPPDGEHAWYLTQPTPAIGTTEQGSGLTGDLSDLDVPEAGLWVSVDHLPFVRAGSSFAMLVPEGRHDVRWFAEDAAGNRGAIKGRVFQVDTSVPLSSYAAFPPAPNAAGWFRSEVLSTLTASDGRDNSGPHTETWGQDAAPTNAYFRPVPAGEGDHNVSFYARDVAGRVERPQSVRFRVDLRAPVAQPQSVPGPLPTLSILGAPAPLAFTAGDDRSANVRAIVRVFDLTGHRVRDIDLGMQPAGAIATSWDGVDDAGDRALPGLYYFRVLVADEAGNTGMSGESREFLVV